VGCNNEWGISRHSKKSRRENVEEIILTNIFWDSVANIIKIFNAIFYVFHVFGGGKPCMGFVYEGMYFCKPLQMILVVWKFIIGIDRRMEEDA
jgi:hypothetical protein